MILFYSKFDALDVSEYILWFCENKLNNPISNLRLQKILYLIQGEYLSKYKEFLFDNKIEVWSYGPVIPDSYFTYQNFYMDNIKGIKPIKNILTEKEISIIEKVILSSLNVNTWELVRKCKNHIICKDNLTKNPKNEVSQDKLYDFFVKNV